MWQNTTLIIEQKGLQPLDTCMLERSCDVRLFHPPGHGHDIPARCLALPQRHLPYLCPGKSSRSLDRAKGNRFGNGPGTLIINFRNFYGLWEVRNPFFQIPFQFGNFPYLKCFALVVPTHHRNSYDK